MASIITLYNRKGGVSKTTTSFNLAHALAEHCGSRVLLVDADPQCNLTELALSPLLSELDEKTEKTGELGDLPGTTLLEALRPRFNGDRPDVDVNAIDLVDVGPASMLRLFRGDIDLNEAEDRFSQAHAQRVTCDRFLVPVAPDRFNYQAIGSLTRILGRWIKDHHQVVDDFREMGLNISAGTPVLHGLVMQRYQRYAKEPKRSFKIWIERIAERAQTELLPGLVAISGDPGIVAPGLKEDPTVASIPDFSGLGPIMLAVGKRVWRIEKAEADFRGVVWEQTEERLEDFRDTHYKLAQSLVDATMTAPVADATPVVG